MVAIDPTTGAILAMVSSPSFDPNALASHAPAEVRENYERLEHDEVQADAQPRAAPDLPAGLDVQDRDGGGGAGERSVQPGHRGQQRRASSTSRRPTATLPNYNNAPCSPAGSATLTDALMHSCNAAFGQIGLDLGADALRAQAEKFGFNEAFEVPMRSVASRFPENLERAADRAVGDRPVRRPRDAAADGDGGRGGRQRRTC